jgi:aminoglycoside/choline kinase family phosphotransferase
LIAKLEETDRRNKEDALYKVINEAKDLIKNVDIPPSDITPFEDALMCFFMLSWLNYRHYEFFGIPEGQPMTEEIKLSLYASMTEEQKNVLKRDYITDNLLQTRGINKKSALLIEFVKFHFPDKLAEIESIHNDEYLKQNQLIHEQIDKLKPQTDDELKEVA